MKSPLAEQKNNNMDGKQPKGCRIKFHLQKPNSAMPDEFFFTDVDEATARDMILINQEIAKIIPEIKKRKFALKWVDTEGNEKTVSNNEALGAALKEMKGPIYK